MAIIRPLRPAHHVSDLPFLRLNCERGTTLLSAAANRMREDRSDDRHALRSAFDALERLIRPLPKLELHAHLTGCVRPSTVYEFVAGNRRGIARFTRPLGRLSFSAQAADYQDFFVPWKRTLRHVPDSPLVVQRLIAEISEDFSRDGVIYGELRVSPRIPAMLGNLPEYLAALDVALNESKRSHGIDLRVVLGFTRHHFARMRPRDRARLLETILAAAEPYRGTSIVGFDLWGDETSGPPSAFTRLFSAVRRAGYPVTIHAGENGNPAHILHALQELNCDRLSHGPALLSDSAVSTMIRDEDILTEVCLTSNWITRAVPTFASHPVAHMKHEGLPFTLCADNTTVCRTSLSREYAKALFFGLVQVSDLPQLFQNALNHTFASAASRQQMQDSIAIRTSKHILSDLHDAVASTRENYGRVLASSP